MPLDHATAADLLEAYARARETFEGDAFTDLFTEDAAFVDETAGERLVGHNALRAALLERMAAEDQVEFTVEQHWVIQPTVIATWQLSLIRRSTGERVRSVGVVLIEVAEDGRISHLREWSARRDAGRAGEGSSDGR